MGISAGEVATASDVRKLEMICENQTFTRALNAASGDVAYTGYGFTPKALIAYAHYQSASTVQARANYGTYASTHFVVMHNSAASGGAVFSSTLLFNMIESIASVGQFASVKSLDADGFTLSWGNPNGGNGTTSADLSILAIGDGT